MTILAPDSARALDTVTAVLSWAAADPIARHMNVRQFECVLHLVDAGPAGVAISELARRIGTPRYAASRAVEQLANIGLASRTFSEEDRRLVFAHATDECNRLRERFNRQFTTSSKAA